MYNEGPLFVATGGAALGLALLRPGSRCMLSRIALVAEPMESCVFFRIDRRINCLSQYIYHTEKLLHNGSNQRLVLGQILQNDFGRHTIGKCRAQILHHAARLLRMIMNTVCQLRVSDLRRIRYVYIWLSKIY